MCQLYFASLWTGTLNTWLCWQILGMMIRRSEIRRDQPLATFRVLKKSEYLSLLPLVSTSPTLLLSSLKGNKLSLFSGRQTKAGNTAISSWLLLSKYLNIALMNIKGLLVSKLWNKTYSDLRKYKTIFWENVSEEFQLVIFYLLPWLKRGCCFFVFFLKEEMTNKRREHKPKEPIVLSLAVVLEKAKL